MIKRKTLVVIFTVFILLGATSAKAQETSESIVDEVSYVFVEKLIAMAKENYPRLKAHNSHVRIAENAVTSAKLSWFAPLSLSYVYSPSNTLNLANPTFFSGYQIGFNVNLGSLLQTPASIKQTKEELKINKYEREEYLLELNTTVKTRYFNYLRTVKALKINKQDALNAHNILTMIKYKYEKGEATLEEYTNAASMHANLISSKLEMEVNFLVAKAELEELIGVKLEAIPN